MHKLEAILQFHPEERVSHGLWATTHQSLHPVTLEVVDDPVHTYTHIPVLIEVDAPDDVTVTVEAQLHIPTDLDVGHDKIKKAQTHSTDTFVIEHIYDLPNHAPEGRGHSPGPHGYQNPEFDFVATASDGGTYPVAVTIQLHPFARIVLKDASAETTGKPIHVAMETTDVALNGGVANA